MNWQEIYNKNECLSQYILEDTQKIIDFSGFNGKLNAKDYLQWIEKEKEYFKDSKYIYEFGCGCGLFLNNISNHSFHSYGIDFSDELLKLGKYRFPLLKLEKNNIENIDVSKIVSDTICSFSVFQYLEKSFSLNLLSELRNNRFIKNIFIYDIPDINKKEKDIEWRKKENLPESNHTYYDKKEIIDLFKNKSYKLIIEDQNIPNYKNNEFRFNLKIWK